MKFITTIITGAIVGALGVYFTLHWQEESLTFTITPPAKFGDINYQNITLTNDGWDPATNVKIYVSHPNIKFGNVQSSVSLKDLSAEKDAIAGIERVRRDESIVFSLAYTGQPLFGSEVKIVSDRSVATRKEIDNSSLPMWAKIILWFFGLSFVFGLISAIVIPAYENYKTRAASAAQKNARS